MGKKKIGKSRLFARLTKTKYVHAPTVDFHRHEFSDSLTLVDCPPDEYIDADAYLLVIHGGQGDDYVDHEIFVKLKSQNKIITTVVVNGSQNFSYKYPAIIIDNSADLDHLLQACVMYEHAPETELQTHYERIITNLQIMEQEEVMTAQQVEHLPADSRPTIQLIGRENAGKSTMFQAISGVKTKISPIGGTTKKGLSYQASGYILSDTAGKRMDDRADVVIVVIDATVGLLKSDRQMLSAIEGRICICAWNKCTSDSQDSTIPEPQDLQVPIVRTSGQTGMNLDKLMQLAQTLYAKSRIRISTSQIMRFIQDSQPSFHLIKVKYGVHVSCKPYMVVLFVNKLHQAKHLRKKFIQYFDLFGVQVIMKLKLSN